jgi:hypothetical protein
MARASCKLGPSLPAAAPSLLAAALALCGCGGASPAAGGSRKPIARPAASRWLTLDARRRRATVSLIVGYDSADNGLNIDGAVKGALLFVVPTGWRLRVMCRNASASTRFSCLLTSAPASRQRLPQRLRSRQPEQGLPAGGQFTFEAGSLPVGHYRLAAAAATVEPAGMWVVLDVPASGYPRAEWLR